MVTFLKVVEFMISIFTYLYTIHVCLIIMQVEEDRERPQDASSILNLFQKVRMADSVTD